MATSEFEDFEQRNPMDIDDDLDADSENEISDDGKINRKVCTFSLTIGFTVIY